MCSAIYTLKKQVPCEDHREARTASAVLSAPPDIASATGVWEEIFRDAMSLPKAFKRPEASACPCSMYQFLDAVMIYAKICEELSEKLT